MSDYTKLEAHEIGEDNKKWRGRTGNVFRLAISALLLISGVVVLHYSCCEKDQHELDSEDMATSLRNSDDGRTYPMFGKLGFDSEPDESDANDSCMKLQKEDACSSDEKCVWCESKAVPSKCYEKELAKRLPPGVFVCHFNEPFNPPIPDSISVGKLDMHLDTISSKEDSTFQGFSEQELLCDPNVNQATGYFRLAKQNKHYFFWFFESRSQPENDPLVLWLTGGPGCSSELALFVENGPCTVSSDGTSTSINEFSWNTKANIIFIDQPAGTGFSYGDHDTNEVSVGNDLDMFLVEFLSKFPQYSKSDFYVFGESYAGHYVPAVAHAVVRRNKGRSNKINIKGIGIGNGLTDPMVQYEFYAEMAYNSGTAPARVSKRDYENMKAATPKCLDLIKKCNEYGDEDPIGEELCTMAYDKCNDWLFTPYGLSGYNQYDMRIKCEVPGLCYDFSNVNKFLHRKSVLDYLGVAPEKRDWQSCDDSAHKSLVADWMKNYQDWVTDLLEGEDSIRVLVYAGDVDFIVNYMGCEAWPLRLQWSGQKEYNAAKKQIWKVDNQDAGLLRSFGNLSFLQVFQAGHMVPMDKPKVALAMLNSFIEVEKTV